MANEIVGEKREGDGSIRSADGIPMIEETYTFRVKAESRNTSRIDILTTPGLPIIGHTVSAYGMTVCQSKEAARDPSDPLYWDVTCSFSSEVKEGESEEPQAAGQDPESWVPIYETKFEKIQEIVTKDKAGKSIANSVGQPFSDGVARTRTIAIWEFWQFESAAITDEKLLQRNEAVNSETFKEQPPWTLQIHVLSSSIGYYFGVRRRLTHYAIKVNKNNWKHKRLDVGPCYLDGGRKVPFVDEQNNTYIGALDGEGGAMPDGEPPEVLQFELDDAIDFATFIRVPPEPPPEDPEEE